MVKVITLVFGEDNSNAAVKFISKHQKRIETDKKREKKKKMKEN